MNVAILETKHFEVLRATVRFFDSGRNRLFLFVTPFVHEQSRKVAPGFERDCEWRVLDEPGQEKRLLRSIVAVAEREGLDLFWISTITNNYLTCASVVRALRRRGCPAVMTLHNVNYWLRPGLPRSRARVGEWLGKKALVSALSGFNVLSEAMIPAVKGSRVGRKPVVSVPSAVFEGAVAGPAEGDGLVLVVPGSVEEKRRDYEALLDAFEKVGARHPEARLVLLGGPVGDYGGRILARCEELRRAGLGVTSYDGFVPQAEFDAWMSRAALVVAPMRLASSFAGIGETYGATKSPGLIGDALTCQRPLLVPKGLALPSALESAALRYGGTESLTEVLLDFAGSVDARQRLAARAIEVAAGFTREGIFERNREAFELLVPGGLSGREPLPS